MCQMTRVWIALTVLGLAALGPCGVARAQGTSEAYFGTFYKPVCDRLIAGFEAGTQTSWRAWKQRNHEAVAALERNPEFLAKRKEALVPPPPELLEAKTRELSVTCERLTNLYEAALPADARFEAPEKTWETFRKALLGANREVLRECLTGEARKGLSAPLQAMTDEQLRRMGDAVAEIKLMERSAAYQDAMVVQKDGAAGRVGFVRNGANWKIAQM